MKALCVLVIMAFFVGQSHAKKSNESRFKRFKNSRSSKKSKSSKSFIKRYKRKKYNPSRPYQFDLSLILKDYKEQNKTLENFEPEKPIGLAIGFGYEFLSEALISTTSKLKLEASIDSVNSTKASSTSSYGVMSYAAIITQSLNVNLKLSKNIAIQPNIEIGGGYGVYRKVFQGSVEGQEFGIDFEGKAPILAFGAGINLKMNSFMPYLKYQVQQMEVDQLQVTATSGTESESLTVKNETDAEKDFTNHNISAGIIFRF